LWWLPASSRMRTAGRFWDMLWWLRAAMHGHEGTNKCKILSFRGEMKKNKENGEVLRDIFILFIKKLANREPQILAKWREWSAQGP